MFDLLKKNVSFKWSKSAETAFQELKSKLITSPILQYPNFEKPFILYTDACDKGLGAILSQKIDDKEVVVAYASQTLSKAEKNYSITEKEGLGIVWSIQHFCPYLLGVRFQLVTDHNALT